MLIGGFEKNSLIDYPKKISSVIFLSGCNFDCPYCHNPELVRDCKSCSDTFLSQESIFKFLKNRRSFFFFLVISGGEPTLNADLLGFCEKIKNMGYPVKIDTNGSCPEVIKELIDKNLIDYIAMDIKTDLKKYFLLTKKDCIYKNILLNIENIMNSKISYEFKTTCIRPLVDAQIIEDISILIKGADLYALQQCQKTNVLHPEFFKESYNVCYYKQELLEFKSIADKYVKNCIVR